MTAADLPFEQIWFADFECISRPGELPDVICLCARELRSGQNIRLWRGDETNWPDVPPYRIDDNSLFVCFVANAECLCHLTLGWPLPRDVLDLSPTFRGYLNGRHPPAEGKGLIGALSHFGLGTTGGRRKDAMRSRILQGRPFSLEEQAQILIYCMSDVDALVQLLPKLLPHVDLDIALHWGEFAAVSAAMEHRGVPIDMEICRQLQDKATWAFARDAMVPAIDAQYGVYVRGKDGEWHFNIARFEDYLARVGIDWPRDDASGKLNLRRNTFDSMAKARPELEALRQLPSGHPQALALFRKILRASAAIPGAFQPVMIDVEIDGHKYQEMHVDGGAIAQLFLYPPTIELKKSGVTRKRYAYIIRNAKLDPNYGVSERRTVSIAGRAIDTMLAASGHNDVLRAYFVTQRDGVDYNLAYIGADFSAAKSGEFDKAYMNALYEYGYQQANGGREWHKMPPALEAAAADLQQ